MAPPPPPPPSLGIAAVRLALANEEGTVPPCIRQRRAHVLPKCSQQGAWGCLEKLLHPKTKRETKKSPRVNITPLASAMSLQGSCRMLGPPRNCPPGPGLHQMRWGLCSVDFCGVLVCFVFVSDLYIQQSYV